MFWISPLLKFIMSTIYERSTSNPSTQLTTFVEFEFNKTSLVYSGLILVSFRSAWACIRSVHSTYIDVYCFRVVKNTKLFAISASFRFFVRNRGFSLQHGNPKHTHTRRRRGARTETFDTKNCFFLRSKERKRCFFDRRSFYPRVLVNIYCKNPDKMNLRTLGTFIAEPFML